MSETNRPSGEKTILFTIGFAGKTAREFFALLKKAGVHRVIDARLNNHSQLAGFTKQPDFEFFLSSVGSIAYEHVLDLAPTKELLDAYRKKAVSWREYELRFLHLMTDRRVENILTPAQVNEACILCSEPRPDKCHRRLVAEYLKSKWQDVDIRHL